MTCGGGIQERNRDCEEPQYGGYDPCYNNWRKIRDTSVFDTDTRPCGERECPGMKQVIQF